MAPEECVAREFHVQRILAGSEVLEIANDLRSRCIEAGPSCTGSVSETGRRKRKVERIHHTIPGRGEGNRR